MGKCKIYEELSNDLTDNVRKFKVETNKRKWDVTIEKWENGLEFKFIPDNKCELEQWIFIDKNGNISGVASKVFYDIFVECLESINDKNN